MSRNERYTEGEVDSDEEDLSELEQNNLDSILYLFPHRKKLESQDPIDDETFLKVKGALTCPVCLDIYKDPVYIKKCFHRFCRVCIEKVIRSQDNKTCPACRVQLGSKRLLRNDKWTEGMIKKVFHNLKEFQQKENIHYQNFYKAKTKEFKDQSRYPNRRRNTRSSGPEALQGESGSSPVKVKKEALEESKQEKMPIRVADRTRKALELHKSDNNAVKPETKPLEKPVEKPKKTKEVQKPAKIEKPTIIEKPKKIEKEPPKPKKETPPKKSLIEIQDEDIIILPKGSSPKPLKKRKPSASEDCIVIDDDTNDVDNIKKYPSKLPLKSPLDITGYPYNPDYLRAAQYAAPFLQNMYLPFGPMMYPPIYNPMDYMTNPMFNNYSPMVPQIQQPNQNNKQFESMLKNTPNTKPLNSKDGTGNEQKIGMLSQNDRLQYGQFFSQLVSGYPNMIGYSKNPK